MESLSSGSSLLVRRFLVILSIGFFPLPTNRLSSVFLLYCLFNSMWPGSLLSGGPFCGFQNICSAAHPPLDTHMWGPLDNSCVPRQITFFFLCFLSWVGGGFPPLPHYRVRLGTHISTLFLNYK
jgi:hypothetical protein